MQFDAHCYTPRLETAANPYIALVGPLGMGESRLGFAQGFQAVGTICASLLEYRPIFSKLSQSNQGVADVNWVFLAIVFFIVSLAVIFYYFPLPEIKWVLKIYYVSYLHDSDADTERTNTLPYRFAKAPLSGGLNAQSGRSSQR